jgi:hypothetical protein
MTRGARRDRRGRLCDADAERVLGQVGAAVHQLDVVHADRELVAAAAQHQRRAVGRSRARQDLPRNHCEDRRMG